MAIMKLYRIEHNIKRGGVHMVLQSAYYGESCYDGWRLVARELPENVAKKFIDEHTHLDGNKRTTDEMKLTFQLWLQNKFTQLV